MVKLTDAWSVLGATSRACPRYQLLASVGDAGTAGIISNSETLPVDATRGVRDWSDDLRALFEAMGLAERPIHLLGWSMGGGVVMQYTLDHPAHVASLTLQAPVSPYGFGGTIDTAGTLAYADGAGSGGGAANPEFVQRVAKQEVAEVDANSPSAVMNASYRSPTLALAAFAAGSGRAGVVASQKRMNTARVSTAMPTSRSIRVKRRSI